MSNNFCPECNKPLSVKAKRCRCGWIGNDINSQQINHHRCEYISSISQCWFDGTNCQSLYGKGPWYCLGHLQNLADKKKCEEIVWSSINKFEEVMESKIDWRRKLFPEDYRAMKVRINNLLNELKKK